MRKIFRRSRCSSPSSCSASPRGRPARPPARRRSGERPGLRPAAGHEVVRPLGAVRRSGLREGVQGGRRDGLDQQRAERPAEAEGAGPGVPGRRREGGHRDRARQRLGSVDREAVHLDGREGDRLRPPGDRRHRVGLRHVRRQGGRRGAGQRHHRRAEGDGQVQQQARRRRALGRPDRPERVLVQERQRRRPQPAVQERRDDEGPAAVRARLACNERGPIFAQMLVKTNNKIDAAIAANDNIAGAVIADQKAKGLEPDPAAAARTRPRRASSTSSPAGRRARSTSTCPTRRTPRPRLRSRSSRARSRRRTRSG